MKKNLSHGFVLMAVLSLSALLGATVVISFAFKRLIDTDTRNANIRHAAFLIEDNIRTQIKLLAMSVNSAADSQIARNTIIANLKDFADSSKPNYKKIPISGASCGANPCYVFIKSLVFTDNDGNVVADSLATKAIFEMKAEEMKKNSSGILELEERGSGIKENKISISIPLVADITKTFVAQADSLYCPLDKPVFQGTEVVGSEETGYRLQVKCAVLPPDSGQSYQITCDNTVSGTCTRKKVSCNVDAGYWLSSLNPNMSPRCLVFPAGTQATNSTVTLCSGGQFARGFNFTNTFEVKGVSCESPKGPYSFQAQAVPQ